jgi:hypothetical protein
VNDYQLLPVEAGLFYTADFTDELPEGVTVASCAWSITPIISAGGQVDDFGSNKSSIKVSGAQHGVSYALQAKATLSNTEIVVKDISLQGFNG